jgi:crooked neck
MLTFTIFYRAIYELAVSQVDLDMPEVLWKAYIDFEVAEGEVDHARKLYERLLFRSSHVKVWIAYAKFEYESGTGAATGGETSAAAVGPGNIVAARDIFTKG